VKELLKLFWKDFKIPICVIGVIVGSFYIAKLSDATMNPWTLWRQEWQETSAGVDQRRVASHNTKKACLDQQWNELSRELKLKEKAVAFIPKVTSLVNLRSVVIQEGITIFEFNKQSLSFFSSAEAAALPAEMQVATIGAVSYFCAPTSNFFGLWPFHKPQYNAASDTLTQLGQRTLSVRAKQMLGD